MPGCPTTTQPRPAPALHAWAPAACRCSRSSSRLAACGPSRSSSSSSAPLVQQRAAAAAGAPTRWHVRARKWATRTTGVLCIQCFPAFAQLGSQACARLSAARAAMHCRCRTNVDESQQMRWQRPLGPQEPVAIVGGGISGLACAQVRLCVRVIGRLQHSRRALSLRACCRRCMRPPAAPGSTRHACGRV